jgi:hypothetical protein
MRQAILDRPSVNDQPALERWCQRWQELDTGHAIRRPEGRDQRRELRVVGIGVGVRDRVVEKTQLRRAGEEQSERTDSRKIARPA